MDNYAVKVLIAYLISGEYLSFLSTNVYFVSVKFKKKKSKLSKLECKNKLTDMLKLPKIIN